MEVYQGKSVFGGIAIGRISVHKKDEQQVKACEDRESRPGDRSLQTGQTKRHGAAAESVPESLERSGRSQCSYFSRSINDAGG